MPAIETLPVAVNPRTKLEGSKKPATTATDADFEQAMQQALEPHSQKVTDKNSATDEHKTVAPATDKKKKIAVADDDTSAAVLALNASLLPVDLSPKPTLLKTATGEVVSKLESPTLLSVEATAKPIVPKLPMNEVVTGKKQSVTEVSLVAFDPAATLTGVDKKNISPKVPATLPTDAASLAKNKSQPTDAATIKTPTDKNLKTELTPSLLDETVVMAEAPMVLSDPEIMPKTEVTAEALTPIQGKDKSSADRSKTTPVTTVNSGTGVASIPIVMKNSDKMDFFADSAGQKLPSAGPARLAEEGLSSFLKNLPSPLPEKNSADLLTPLTGVDNFSTDSTTTTTTINILTATAQTDARTQLVERTHDLVSAHALRVQEAKTDSMSVVLKPDSGTELSLQLRQKDGVVEAQAVLSQGDHQLLNQHWADLQARLELRGIKLGALGGEGNVTSGNFNSENGGRQQRPPTREETADYAAAFAEFAAITGGASARLATSVRGWESWA